MYKLRVEFIKSLGFMFAIGDEYSYPIGTLKVEQRYLLHLNSDVNKDWSDRFITHFADRINTDNKGHLGLDESFPIEWTSKEGIKYTTEISGLRWNENLVSWKPDYEGLLKMQNEHDTLIANKAISDDLDKIAESIGMFRQVAGKPILSSSEQPTSGSINWADDTQYALVGDGGEAVLCDHKPVENGYFGLEVYTYFGRCYRKEYYTLVKREEKETVKLTSNDVDWEDGMNYAVVHKEYGEVSQYTEYCKQGLSRQGNDVYYFNGNMYHTDRYYIINREQEQMGELLYTKEMKDKGELPKAGMNCEYYGDKCNVIGVTNSSMIVIENTCGGIIVCSLDNIKPIETEQDRIDKLKTDQRKEVYDTIHGKLGHLLSPLYYTYIDNSVKELQDKDLLSSVSDSNES